MIESVNFISLKQHNWLTFSGIKSILLKLRFIYNIESIIYIGGKTKESFMALSTGNYLKLFIIGGVFGIIFSLIIPPSSESMANFAFVEEENRFGETEEDLVFHKQALAATRDSFESFKEATPIKAVKQAAPLLEILENGQKQKLETFEITVKSGDTLDKILNNSGFSRAETYDAIKSFSDVFNPRSLKVGQVIKLVKAIDTTSDEISLESMTIEPRVGQRFSVRRDENRNFKPFEEKDKLTAEVLIAAGVINNSLLSSALEQNIPSSVVHSAINVLSHTVDFRRDLRKGDEFTIMYEVQKTPNGQTVGSGNLSFASLKLRGHDISIYRYTDASGWTDFYDEKGRSLKKSLNNRPVNNVRISSGFGMRRHPITGRRGMHWGTDFAAPSGTPIKAAGDGVITQRKYNGAYGNYVELRHNNEFSTAYAHLSRFAKGVNVGTRVKQGQVVGYVGSTGRSTGPHLHFEVHKSGRRVNPMTVKAPVGRVLEGRELESFNTARKEILAKYAKLTSETKTALVKKD